MQTWKQFGLGSNAQGASFRPQRQSGGRTRVDWDSLVLWRPPGSPPPASRRPPIDKVSTVSRLVGKVRGQACSCKRQRCRRPLRFPARWLGPSCLLPTLQHSQEGDGSLRFSAFRTTSFTAHHPSRALWSTAALAGWTCALIHTSFCEIARKAKRV